MSDIAKDITPRDPRYTPVAGDVLLSRNQTFSVVSSHRGMITVQLGSGGVYSSGIQSFRTRFKEADIVVHAPDPWAHKCRFCGDTECPRDQYGYCDNCNRGMMRNSD